MLVFEGFEISSRLGGRVRTPSVSGPSQNETNEMVSGAEAAVSLSKAFHERGSSQNLSTYFSFHYQQGT